jgi:hypothetical protein
LSLSERFASHSGCHDLHHRTTMPIGALWRRACAFAVSLAILLEIRHRGACALSGISTVWRDSDINCHHIATSPPIQRHIFG